MDQDKMEIPQKVEEPLPAPEIQVADAKLSLKEKIAYGMGDLYSAGGQSLISSVYLVFLVINGLEAGLAATIIMIGKIWDAVTDPAMGIISDNTRTKWGRRKPYLFIGAFLIIVSFILLFLPLHAWTSMIGKFIVYLMSYLIYNTISTMINVPYLSLATEMTSNYYEKIKMNNIRQIFSSVSAGISAGVPIILLEKLQKGEIPINLFVIIMIVVFGLFYAVPMLVTSIVCQERLAIPDAKVKFNLKNFVKPLRLKAFVYLVLMYLFAFSCMDLITSNLVWFANYALELSYSSVFLLGIIMVSYVGMIPVHAHFMKKGKSKSFLFRAGIPLYITGIVVLCLYPSTWNDYVLLPIGLLVGVGMSGCQLMPWYIFPDVVDIGELKFGERNTGSYSGIMTFIRKSTSAIAIGISGWALQLSGFQKPQTDPLTGFVNNPTQPESAILGLRLVIMVPIIVFITFAFIASMKLKITPEKSTLVSKLISDKEAVNNLTDEETKLLEDVKKDLF
ncbi:MAG TPA: MFS transporter [Clostridia bacterium]|jgi:oligogalacturonide transporter|nr:MFS transporter [Clostridia bacterium]